MRISTSDIINALNNQIQKEGQRLAKETTEKYAAEFQKKLLEQISMLAVAAHSIDAPGVQITLNMYGVDDKSLDSPPKPK